MKNDSATVISAVFFLIALALTVAANGAIVYVAYHFIAKYW